MSLRSRHRQSPVAFIEPCLPSVAIRPPKGPGWIHEIKHDGYRLLAQRHDVGGRLLTRNGNDWSARYPAVLDAISALKVRSCLIDSEIAVCDESGLAVFQRLRHGSRIKPEAVLFAFDLLELDGEDLRAVPIEARKQKLAKLVRNAGAGLHRSEHLHGDGMEIFEHACKLGCEGIVSKRVGSRYVSGRTDNWIRRRPRSSARLRKIGASDARRGTISHPPEPP
jgi:bifunctional non-homologous end joining protein LigD